MVLCICHFESRLAGNVGGKRASLHVFISQETFSFFFPRQYLQSFFTLDRDALCLSPHPWTFSVRLASLRLATFPSVSTLLLIHAAGGSACEPACVSLPGRQAASKQPAGLRCDPHPSHRLFILLCLFMELFDLIIICFMARHGLEPNEWLFIGSKEVF